MINFFRLEVSRNPRRDFWPLGLPLLLLLVLALFSTGQQPSSSAPRPPCREFSAWIDWYIGRDMLSSGNGHLHFNSPEQEVEFVVDLDGEQAMIAQVDPKTYASENRMWRAIGIKRSELLSKYDSQVGHELTDRLEYIMDEDNVKYQFTTSQLESRLGHKIGCEKGG